MQADPQADLTMIHEVWLHMLANPLNAIVILGQPSPSAFNRHLEPSHPPTAEAISAHPSPSFLEASHPLAGWSP
jgi:hypothetical protein